MNITLAKPGLDGTTFNALNGDDLPIGGLGQDDLGPGHNRLIW